MILASINYEHAFVVCHHHDCIKGMIEYKYSCLFFEKYCAELVLPEYTLKVELCIFELNLALGKRKAFCYIKELKLCIRIYNNRLINEALMFLLIESRLLRFFLFDYIRFYNVNQN